jgi:hypothetical protein
VAFSPQANFTYWATDTDGRILVPTFVDRGVLRGQRGGTPTVDYLSLLHGNIATIFYDIMSCRLTVNRRLGDPLFRGNALPPSSGWKESAS